MAQRLITKKDEEIKKLTEDQIRQQAEFSKNIELVKQKFALQKKHFGDIQDQLEGQRDFLSGNNQSGDETVELLQLVAELKRENLKLKKQVKGSESN